ncbi:MAG: hypothetical protein ACLGIF_11460 [Actinomycetes bacterium]
MDASLRFSWAGATVDFDTTNGTVLGVRHPAQPGLNYLTGLWLPTLTRDGQPVRWSTPTLAVDHDELELTAGAGPLRVTLRHSFLAVWTVRLVLAVTDDQPGRLTAELPMAPGPGAVGWGMAAGAEADYTVHPPSGRGPLLGGSLRRGAVRRLDPHALVLEQVELGAAKRYVLQWQWDFYASPRAYGESRTHGLPTATAALVDEPVTFSAGDDVVVLPPAAVGAEREGEVHELTAGQAGTYPLELRSARGRTRLDLHWAEPAVVLGRAAEAVLARRPTTAGVVRLSGAAEALVVQHALATGLPDPPAAEEALDLYTARRLAAPSLSVLEAAYLAAEAGRTGDVDARDAARRAVMATTQTEPGLGVTGMRLALTLTVAGETPAPVLRHLEALARSLPPPATGSVSTQAAAVELLAVTAAGPGARTSDPAGRDASTDAASRARALGALLGGGLPGQALRPLDAADLSQVLGTLLLLPEATDDGAIAWWGCSPAALARRLLPQVLARLQDREVGLAHAWLTLLAPAG